MVNNTIEIVPYSEENASYIKSLNIAWLEKYFYVEPIDELVLSNPKTEIIDKGGKIFFAKYNNQIVGTFSLLKIDEITFELSKMAVSENFQGLGIGKALLQHCIDFCKENNISKIILFSNTLLISAIAMYRNFGFVEIETGSSSYKRANIKMEKII